MAVDEAYAHALTELREKNFQIDRLHTLVRTQDKKRVELNVEIGERDARIEKLGALLREARDWIALELQATEDELPDAEDLVIRMGRALPEEAT